MRIVTKILATIFILVGIGTLFAYSFSILSENADINPAVDIWGISSALALSLAGVLLLKNSMHSAWLLALSILLYFLGAIVPAWPRYGVDSFTAVMNAFYYSLAIRFVMSIVAIYALMKTSN